MLSSRTHIDDFCESWTADQIRVRRVDLISDTGMVDDMPPSPSTTLILRRAWDGRTRVVSEVPASWKEEAVIARAFRESMEVHA